MVYSIVNRRVNDIVVQLDCVPNISRKSIISFFADLNFVGASEQYPGCDLYANSLGDTFDSLVE